jgi:hypothetical protein
LFVTTSGGGINEFHPNPCGKGWQGVGLNNASGIAASGDDLFVSNGATIAEYTTSGATVNASLVSGLSSTGYIAVEAGVADATNVQAVPEPTTTMLFGVALMIFCAASRRRKRATA